MRTVFGIVGLVLVVAVTGIVAVRQLRATSQLAARALPPAEGASAALPGRIEPSAGNVREQARQLGQRVQGEIGQSLRQGADGRAAEADK